MPPWPFEDPENTASITTVRVLDGTHPICLVTHDAEDGMWQFLCGTTNAPGNARVVSLHSIVDLDASVAELADLPLGWRASRLAPGDSWHREPTA